MVSDKNIVYLKITYKNTTHKEKWAKYKKPQLTEKEQHVAINRKRPSISSNYKTQIKTQGGDETTDLAVFKSLFCFIFTYKKI